MKIDKVALAFALFVIGIFALQIGYYKWPQILSKDGLVVARVEDKIEYTEEVNGSYYEIELGVHFESHLSNVPVDKHTFNDFQIGDLVSYERDEETGEIKLEHYKK